MPGPPAICDIMPKHAGVMRQSTKNAVQAALESLKTVNGSIKATFQQVASKGKPVYSTHQHTKIEAQYVQLEYLFDRDT